MQTPPCILTIAGSDSGGGAGIQADLKTMTVLGGFGMSVITALTAQNGLGVTGIHAVPPDFVVQQLTTVRDGFEVAAAKTGMLFSAPIISAVADNLADRPFALVVDPVCVSQSGHRLLQEDAIDALRTRMVPLATLLTPNRPEAELLAGMAVNTRDDVAEAGRRLLALGAEAVLIKGGHFEASYTVGEQVDPAMGRVLIDWLCLPGCPPKELPQPRADTPNNHGTGCTLSAAIATFLGMRYDLEEAIIKAQRYLNLSLRTAYAPGKGTGPANHASPFVHLYPLEI